MKTSRANRFAGLTGVIGITESSFGSAKLEA